MASPNPAPQISSESTPAQIWNAARDAEKALDWAGAADLYELGLKRFSAKPRSGIDARLVEMRTRSMDNCRREAGLVS